MPSVNRLLEEILSAIQNGGGGGVRTDYGALTNVQILAISTPDELGEAFSTDDNVNYTFYNGAWYNEVGRSFIMSKLNVGQGFSYPDTTEQDTAGVINDSQTAYFYSLSGDSNLNGRSPEKAKATIQDAINAANSNPSSITTVNEAEGGVYVEDIILYDGVLFEGTQTAIVTTGLVGVVSASGQSFRPQAIIGDTDNASLIVTDGQEQFGLDVRSLEIGGASSIGIEIKGDNSGLFYTVSEVSVDGANSTVVSNTQE